jgi:hypothetical protein
LCKANRIEQDGGKIFSAQKWNIKKPDTGPCKTVPGALWKYRFQPMIYRPLNAAKRLLLCRRHFCNAVSPNLFTTWAVHIHARGAHLHIAAAFHAGAAGKGIALFADGKAMLIRIVRCALFCRHCGTVMHYACIVVVLIRKVPQQTAAAYTDRPFFVFSHSPLLLILSFHSTFLLHFCKIDFQATECGADLEFVFIK